MLHDAKNIRDVQVAEIDATGSAHVEQIIHGRAEGPIQMQLRAL